METPSDGRTPACGPSSTGPELDRLSPPPPAGNTATPILGSVTPHQRAHPHCRWQRAEGSAVNAGHLSHHHTRPTPASSASPILPVADAITIARIAASLSALGKEFIIRPESASSFADLRDRSVVLVGAFNNVWSLRLTRGLRLSLALDPEKRVIYIRDRLQPQARQWQWGIDPHPEAQGRSTGTVLHDYALITRLVDSETGHDVVIIGGLYVYGTQAAGKFISGPQLESVAKGVSLDSKQHRLQIVLETQVTDGTAGPPEVVAISTD